jgi:competence protein ComEC
MTSADLRLAIPAAFGWIAAAMAIGWPDAALPALVIGWVAAGALAVLRPRLALALGAVALCCTSVALQSPARSPPAMDVATEKTVSFVATATESVAVGQGSFEVRLDEVEGTRVSVPALVFGAAPERRLGIGTVIRFSARASATESGDSRAFLVFPNDPPEVVVAPASWLAWADHWRSGFLAIATALPGDGGALLAGLAIGDTSAVSATLDTAMKSSSLTHLTAVSGANCAIVIGLVMLAGAALGFPRWVRIGCSVLALLAFVVLVTPQPSVLRAAVMAALVLLATQSGRTTRGLPVLALATLALLVADPWLAREYGFALSVLATAGLLVLAGPLAGALGRWMPRWIALVVAVPLSAQLACQPVLILLDASIPTYGVIANLLAGPAAPLATVVGLAACAVASVAPGLGGALAGIAWLPSAWIAAVARFFAGLPFARIPWPEGAPGAGLVVAISALGIAALLTQGRWRRRSGFAMVVVLVVCGAVAVGGRVAHQSGRPDWQYAACDVGQGDAMLVRSAGMTALIDTGPEPEPLAACLADLGIGRVDLLVLTHFDLDHVGGVDAVLGRADRVLVGPSGSADDDVIVADFAAHGAHVERATRGMSGMLGELRWSVLWPPVEAAGVEPGNGASVTTRFDGIGRCSGGCLSSVFLGDLGEEAQSRVLRLGLQSADVVKVAHHGSSDQSDQLYARLDAVVGLIGVGADNGYGHPTARLLDLLAASRTVVERTDTDGMVLVAPGETPGTVTVWTARGDVAPGG